MTTNNFEKAVEQFFSAAFLVLGAYYILVGLKIINTKVIWVMAYTPTANTIALVGLVMILIGIILNRILRRYVKKQIS